MTEIETRGLSCVYGEGTPFEKTAVRNLDIKIEKGEFVGLIGQTGSGKSTFLQTLNGLLKPTSGEVLIAGENIWKNPKLMGNVRKKVGLVFQYPEYQLFEETVYKDIAFGPSNLAISKDEINDAVKYAMDVVGLDESFAQKSPFELSGGEKRRVAIAGVLAMKPDIIILDEPTAGLDPRGRNEIISHIKRYHKENNATVILVSHSMEDVAKHATKVLVLRHGEKVMYGTVDETFKKAEEIKQFGLALPQITKIFSTLKKRGFDVNTSIYTVSQGVEEIKRLLGGDADA